MYIYMYYMYYIDPIKNFSAAWDSQVRGSDPPSVAEDELKRPAARPPRSQRCTSKGQPPKTSTIQGPIVVIGMDQHT